jgi:RHS repeat-associated protein
MKVKLNSNLLTIADSPFQHHLAGIILFLSIYRQIQMVLDSPPSPSSRLRSFVAMVLGANAPHLTEESPSYNSERSDCLNHGFGRPDVASDREEGRHRAFGGGSGSGASSVISSRITGMYFLHPDHLGSITMITDGRGNAIAGGERGGKSHIAYRPYGEIHRTDSFGPDISKYKYTGQEEDKESGLMYYKARYYDSRIGRFLQQDSMAFPNQINGMNRMMYVEGNPVGFRDPSGNNAINGFLGMVATYISQAPGNELLVYASFATGKGGRAARDLVLANATARFLSGEDDLGFSSLSSTNQQNLFYLLSRTKTGTRISDAYRRIFRSIDHSLSKVTRSMDHSLKDINRGVSGTSRGVAKAMDGGARWLASGGKYSRNKGNDIDAFYGDRGINTHGFYRSIQRSDVGRGLTDFNQSGCLQLVGTVVTFGYSTLVVNAVKTMYESVAIALKIGGGISTSNNAIKCVNELGSVDRSAWGQ